MTDLVTRLGQLLWIPLVALALAWALSFTPLYHRLDALSLDAQTRLAARERLFEEVLVIDVDDASLRALQGYFGGWPYKRDTYALLIDYLSEMGARAVVFDMLFADPREGDARLRESIARARNVVLAATASSEGGVDDQTIAALRGLAWEIPAGLPARSWPGVLPPLPAFTQPAPGHADIGVVSVVADADGMLRRLPLFHAFDGQHLPSLPLAAHFSGEPHPRVLSNPDGSIRVGDLAWPTDDEGAVHLNFPRNRNAVLSMSFSRVATAMLGLPGQTLDPALFRGKTVFIGSTAFFTDRVLTPLGEMNGVYVLAIAHQSLAHHLVLTPRHWRWTGGLLLIALLPSLLRLWRPRRSALAGAALSAGSAVAIYGTHLGLLYWLQQESSLLLPLLVMLIAYLLETVRTLRLLHAEQKAKIHVLAYNDPLTRLPNRFSLLASLARTIETARAGDRGLAVLAIGLDDFKAINNTLGHETGDQMLVEVTSRLRACVRSTDVVARLGGDEFGVVISGADAAAAARYAEKILGALARPYHLAGQALHVTSSVGISQYPADATDVALLLKHADAAMCRAKAQGRNSCRLFTPDLEEAAVERLLLENQLHQALARNELVLCYQPQVDMQSGRMVAVEALVRWNHPTRGLLGPDHFIAMAEHSELVLPLGGWVLRTACQQMRAWQLAGLTHIERVAVNLSARQFEQADLPGFVASVLKAAQLDARCLELEITESVAMKNPGRSIDVLNVLRGMGIALALDDFGTGYSSLTYLKQFPISSLKIDGSFVRNIETDRYDAEICAATIALARKLDLRVIAEGIETPGQFRHLRNIQCSEAQGYLISRPLSAEDLGRFQPPVVPT